MLKNYSYLLVWSCLLLSTISTAQINQFEWGVPAGDVFYLSQASELMAADSAGNVFIASAYYGSGNLSIGDTTVSIPQGAMFTAKIDKTGHTEWIRLSTGSGMIGPEPYFVTTDAKGDCYVVGRIQDPPTFHGVTIGNPNDDAFVIKIDQDGNIDWGKSWTGNSGTWENGLLSATIHNGSIRVSGEKGNFYTQLDTIDGNIQYQTTSLQPLNAFRVVTDNQGFNYFICSGISLPTFSLGGLSYTPNGIVSTMIVKQDSVGNSIWIKEFSSDWHKFGDIEIGPDGSIYVLGTVYTSIDLDGAAFLTNPNASLFNFSSTNFVSRFDANMNPIWTQYLGGSEFGSAIADTSLLDLELDPRGNLYAAVTSAGGYWVGNYQVAIPSNLETGLVVKLEPSFGNVTWMKRVEGYTNGPRSLAVSRKGIYLHGTSAGGQVSFINQPVISNQDFLAKINNVEGTNEISGLVFIDDNENGIRDNNETGRDVILVNFNDDFYKSTDTTGQFSDFVPAGTYTLGTVTPKYWTQTRPDTTITFTGNWDIVSGVEFGVKPAGPIQDLEIYVSSTAIRPGFEVRYFVTYRNVGTVPVSGTVELALDDTLSYLSSTPSGSFANSRVTWNYTDLQPNETRYAIVQCQMPVALGLLGTDLFANAFIEPIATDTTPTNNIFNHAQLVTGSYDPNDKLATPSGPVDTSFISDGTFLYRIRFQNTGNDTAFTVRVADTLDNNLDISTFQMVGASHDYVLDLNENALMWTFNNILLPDSTTNEPESHGFIFYSIRPKSTTMLDDTIANTAHIYFDFNPAIVTNTTINDVQIITQTHQVEVQQLERINVFPNPTSGWLVCEVENFQSNETYFFRLFDMQGRLVSENQVMSNRQNIDLPTLPIGMYIYQVISTESGLKGTGKILTR